MIDRRRTPRFAAGIEAFIYPPLRPRLPVLVTDISTHGAMIEFERQEYLPSILEIGIGAFRSRCFIRHRVGRKIGVEFEQAYDWSHENAEHFAAILSPGQAFAWQPRITG